MSSVMAPWGFSRAGFLMGPLVERPHDPRCDEFSRGPACEAAGGALGRAEAKALVSPVEALSAEASGERASSAPPLLVVPSFHC